MTKWVNHETEYENARVNLLCFPHAGGSSTFFAQWFQHFDDTVNVYPVQYPARDNRLGEAMPPTILDLAEQIADGCKEYFDKPFVFLGHCFGSIIAYETAVAVKRKFGKEPILLVTSGSVSPSDLKLRATKNLTDEQFMKYYDFPMDQILIYKELRGILMPMIRGDYVLCEKYRFKPSGIDLFCPIIAMYGASDHALKDIQAVERWSEFTLSDKFELAPFEGDHFYFEKNIEGISKLIGEKLGEILK